VDASGTSAQATAVGPRSDRLRLAARLADIQPFRVMEVGRRAAELERAGRRIVHMEIGQPDFAAPPPVVEAAIAALQRDPMGYTEALGMRALREAIAAFYAGRFGVAVPVERIMVTAGASGAFLLAMGALVDPGDEVLLADPGYPCNRQFVRMFEGRARMIPVGAESAYQLTAAHVADHWGPYTRGVIVASPSNPTGTMVSRDQLAAIIATARARGGWVLVDEIYHGLVYGVPESTALELDDGIVVVNSFSKYFNMTGWRLGWLVAPADAVAHMERLAQNAFICVSAPAQHAALAAFLPETLAILEMRRQEFQRRRDFLVPALRAIGFDVPVLPSGAFYVYADASRFGDDTAALALRVLEQAGVAITPGADFGAHRAERYVRFAYTRAMDDLKEGVERLAGLLQGR
jgi:aspartate/methionine/tyrosine aminotransferase